jgi:hypothetical protein
LTRRGDSGQAPLHLDISSYFDKTSACRQSLSIFAELDELVVRGLDDRDARALARDRDHAHGGVAPLHKVFGKLGISSRKELRSALSDARAAVAPA